MYSTIVVSVIGLVLGTMIGFLFWVTEGGLEGYIIVWSIVILVFIIIMMILFYVGGKNRIREEKELIENNQKKQAKMASKHK